MTKRGIPWQNVNIDILSERQRPLKAESFDFFFDDKLMLLDELPFLKPLRNAILNNNMARNALKGACVKNRCPHSKNKG